eukprot:144690_1
MNTAIKNAPKDRYKDHWIGFYNNHWTRWKWVGPGSSFRLWEPGEPDNYYEQECAKINRPTDSYSGYWSDVTCSNRYPFICAEPGDYPTKSPTTAPTKIPTSSPSFNPSIPPTMNPTQTPITTHSNYLHGLQCDNLFDNVTVEYNMDRKQCDELCHLMSSNCRMANYFDYFKTTNDSSRCYIFDEICKIKMDGNNNNNTNRSVIIYNIFDQECIDYPTDWTDKISNKCNLYKEPWCNNGNILKNENEFDNLMDPQYGITAIEACCECGGGLQIMDDVALNFNYDLVDFEDDILCNFTSLYAKSSLNVVRTWDSFVLFDICVDLMYNKSYCYFLIDNEFDSNLTQYTLFLCEYNQSNRGVEIYDFVMEYVIDINAHNYIYVNTLWFDIDSTYYASTINVSVMDYKYCKDKLLGVNDANYNSSHYSIDGVHACYLEIPTVDPTTMPTQQPTYIPTEHPTTISTKVPTYNPTKNPNSASTPAPTHVPTDNPTPTLTNNPTNYKQTTTITASVGLQQSDVDIAEFELIMIVSISIMVLCFCVMIIIVWKRTSKSKHHSENQLDGLDRLIKKQIEMEMHTMSVTTGNQTDNVVHKPSAPQLDDEKEENLCILCCNDIANMFNDPCGHVTYCYSCATGALEQDARCPNCRAQIHCKQIYI